ncbi:MAG: 4'-phosphopantetheinyl transferase superfamily protein [Thioalkalispiraceae bacterium]|jgi:4'-phosphopantetheinyl transferase
MNTDQTQQQITSDNYMRVEEKIPTSIDTSEHEVHLWVIQHLNKAGNFHSYFELLSSDEKAKAKGFRFDIHRNRYIVFHGSLRQILSRYLDTVTPGEIGFSSIKNNKPIIQPDQNLHKLSFNLSHSADVAIIAIGYEEGIGVDIEKIDTKIEMHDLIQRYYTEQERCTILAQPEADQYRAFYSIWTKKESYMKFTGDGLSLEPDSFEVRPPLAAISQVYLNAEVHVPSCTIQSVALPERYENYVASLATSKTQSDIKMWIYS